MIVRVFGARVHPGREAEFEEKLRSISIPLTRSQAGLRSLHAGRTFPHGSGEYVFVSTWETLDDLKRFVGEDWSEPYLPDGIAPLVDAAWVSHYEEILD